MNTIEIEGKLYMLITGYYPVGNQHKLEIQEVDEEEYPMSEELIEVTTPLEHIDLESNEIILNNYDVVKAMINEEMIDKHYTKGIDDAYRQLYRCELLIE